MSRPPRVSAPRPRQDIRSAGPGRSSFNDDSNSYGKYFLMNERVKLKKKLHSGSIFFVLIQEQIYFIES